MSRIVFKNVVVKIERNGPIITFRICNNAKITLQSLRNFLQTITLKPLMQSTQVVLC